MSEHRQKVEDTQWEFSLSHSPLRDWSSESNVGLLLSVSSSLELVSQSLSTLESLAFKNTQCLTDSEYGAKYSCCDLFPAHSTLLPFRFRFPLNNMLLHYSMCLTVRAWKHGNWERSRVFPLAFPPNLSLLIWTRVEWGKVTRPLFTIRQRIEYSEKGVGTGNRVSLLCRLKQSNSKGVSRQRMRMQRKVS
jgi:hypothetical protein